MAQVLAAPDAEALANCLDGQNSNINAVATAQPQPAVQAPQVVNAGSSLCFCARVAGHVVCSGVCLIACPFVLALFVRVIFFRSGLCVRVVFSFCVSLHLCFGCFCFSTFLSSLRMALGVVRGLVLPFFHVGC